MAINKLLSNIFNSIKEINWLRKEIDYHVKECQIFAWKLLLRHPQNFDFLGLKNLSLGQFWGALTHADIIEFLYFLFQLNNQTSGSKTMCGFSIILILKGTMMLQSLKSSYILLNKNINFNKSGTESKIENPTNIVREMNLVIQVILEWQIKSKTVMSWNSRKKKEGIFLYLLFCPKEIQCIVYLIHFQNINTFTYQKTFLHTLLLLVCKIVESLQCILNLVVCCRVTTWNICKITDDITDT